MALMSEQTASCLQHFRIYISLSAVLTTALLMCGLVSTAFTMMLKYLNLQVQACHRLDGQVCFAKCEVKDAIFLSSPPSPLHKSEIKSDHLHRPQTYMPLRFLTQEEYVLLSCYRVDMLTTQRVTHQHIDKFKAHACLLFFV
mmetsp:Transcript_40417/g.49022  ORF Transcript_40417/g.49022 Transcript_40417/m.49022 type:complete len:142 (+) Transcript_40417:236-661(+)